MRNGLKKSSISLFILLALSFICPSTTRADEEIMSMGWPVDFEYNSKTLPSIEVKLGAPENPMPQVSAELKLLESARLKLEENLMQKLEDEFNKSLTVSKIKIKETVESTLSIFNDPNVLGSIISHSLKIMKKENLRKVQNTFEDKLETKKRNEEETYSEEEDKNGPLPSPPVREHSSFLEKNYVNKTMPSVKISLTNGNEPDISIKEKIEEIEQYRTDEEVAMFEVAISELSSLREITILELEKQIQLQLNPFLVDKKIVHRTLQKELNNLEKREKVNKRKENRESPSVFLEKEEKKEEKEEKEEKEKMIQTEETENEDTGNILNVKISQSDLNYPTIDELVMQMQKRRDITEKLERQKILQLEMKLLKAQSEIIKDALHFSVSKIIAQYSPIVETIKSEALKTIH